MPDIHLNRRNLLASTVLLPMLSAFASRPELYRDAGASIDARVQDLLARMTLDEKVVQLQCIWFGKIAFFDGEGRFKPDRVLAKLPNGIGQISRPGETPIISPRAAGEPFFGIEETVDFVNGMQRVLVEQTRLGIPAIFHDETAHGYMARDATIFPIPPALGSTWDPDLVEQVFTVAAREARVRGGTVALGPVVDLMREPRFGRAEEFFGEDPYLVSKMGMAAVFGHQGRMRPLGDDRVFATLKHFVHGSPQGGINLAPAEMSERGLRENYLVPFAAIIKAADPAIVMPSYNEVEGVPSHANVELLQRTGRERLGFKGLYISDYGGITHLIDHHHVAADKDEAAILAMNAGVDAELFDEGAYAGLASLVRNGGLAEAKIDAAVARVLALKFEAGLFENPYADVARAVRETNRPADIRLARTVAEKAIILLTNDGILPLSKESSLKLAVIGPNSDKPVLGGYTGVNDKSVGVLAGVRAAAGANISIEHADGVWITQPDPVHPDSIRPPNTRVPEGDNAVRIAEAVQVAQRADVILLVVGDNSAVTREATIASRPGDRNSIGLFGQQDALVEAMLATGKPVIAVLLNGRPLAVPRLAEKASALIEGWYLGQEGGNALASVLFGETNPGGKLTVSIPRSTGEIPAFYNRHPSADLNDYVEGPRLPLFAFGHGLSYAQFELSEPKLATNQIAVGDSVVVDVEVKNVSQRAGDEVVQIYVRDQVSSVPRPVLELKAFQRITLEPGETRNVRFELSPDDLAFWNIDMEWKVEPGRFSILAGNSSIALKENELTVVG